MIRKLNAPLSLDLIYVEFGCGLEYCLAHAQVPLAYVQKYGGIKSYSSAEIKNSIRSTGFACTKVHLDDSVIRVVGKQTKFLMLLLKSSDRDTMYIFSGILAHQARWSNGELMGALCPCLI